MTTPVELNPLLLSSVGGYQIERSLRFNSADSAYLNRTPGSAGNRKTWTWSAWVKLGNIGNWGGLFNAGTSGDQLAIYLFTDSTLYVQDFISPANNIQIQTTQVFRDPSAWYHIVVAIDTTQATSTNRVKVYINGSQVTAFSTSTYPSQNYDTQVNSTSFAHNVGRNFQFATSTPKYFDGYMTEINFVDGSQLTPSSFGETDTDTGIWKPKAYSGSYGTNGFYLKFADNSGTTSTTLGKDSSGNGNNWTPNNFSVTAGAGNDSLVDTPTPYGTDTGAGGTVRGNYATLNPLESDTITLSNGNLQGFGGSGGTGEVFSTSTIGMSSGKWYCEVLYAAKGSASALNLGIIEAATLRTTTQTYPDYGYYSNNGNKYNDLSASAYGASWDVNDVIGISYDADAGTLVFYKNGVSQGTAFSGLSGTYFFCQARFGSDSHTTQWNFGQRPFAYAAPSGFKALCTQNLPTPTIGATATTRADDYFNTIIWTGTDTTASRSFTGVGFQPDFVWAKIRSNTGFEHLLYDAVRGAGNDKELSSNSTGAEGYLNTDTQGYLSSFNSDGFSSTAGTIQNEWFNRTGYTYVAWNWKANGAGVTNTQGTITSTVSASTTAGFSIVTYTGNGTSGATVGHGLGVTPSMVMLHRRDAVSNWQVKHVSLNANQNLELNSTAAVDTAPGSGYISAISSTTLTLLNGGSAITNVNTNGGTYLAYCFAPVAGYSAFGSYTGNGSTDGPFVFTGFRPAWVLVKPSSTTGDWLLYDNKRNAYNVVNNILYPNTSGAEATSGGGATLDFVSNGFKLRGAGAGFNNSGVTFIYAAFAENPFKYSLAR